MRSVVDAIHRASTFRRADSPLSFTESMSPSVIDAVNGVCSPRSSLDYDGREYDYYVESERGDGDDGSIYPENGGDDCSIYPLIGREVGGMRRAEDTDSVVDFAAPLLRNKRLSFPEEIGMVGLGLSRGASQKSTVTTFEEDDVPIAQILEEKRRSRPNLPPLVITPIAQAQYGPPIQRRQHLRGRTRSSSLSSTQSPSTRSPSIKSTKVKVVKEEQVEYTPIEEGEKGWMRQRKVSRGGDWVVVEREILKQGAI